MDHISKQKKSCLQSPDGNKFCYKFKEDVDNRDFSKPPASEYWFNGQKRGLPAQPSDLLQGDDLTEHCAFYCGEELGELMTFDEPSSLIPGIGLVSNSVVSYSDVDDMCSTCAA